MIFFSGYWLGSQNTSAFSTRVAHAYDGPSMAPISCNVFTRTWCKNEGSNNYLYINIHGNQSINSTIRPEWAISTDVNPLIRVRLN